MANHGSEARVTVRWSAAPIFRRALGRKLYPWNGPATREDIRRWAVGVLDAAERAAVTEYQEAGPALAGDPR